MYPDLGQLLGPVLQGIQWYLHPLVWYQVYKRNRIYIRQCLPTAPSSSMNNFFRYSHFELVVIITILAGIVR
jgi:hypothetical protein